MKNRVAFIICLLISFMSFGQTTYRIGNYCSINIPNSLQLRETSGIDGSQYVFSPGWTSPYYSRIMVAIIDNTGISQADVSNLSKEEIAELNVYYKREAEQSISSFANNTTDFIWYPLIIKRLSGKYAIVSKYQRPGFEHSPVLVEEYKFFISGTLLRFTLSYRVSENKLWAEDFSKVIPSIVFYK